ncbi:pancreatic triacylglycerol lipase-like [Planococcus citri]|uniref:pancreatic triacylglycerol lipase-like n=1 Tax=Planococcus citri TaxID=170843 RepID=UPI0031FA1F3E
MLNVGSWAKPTFGITLFLSLCVVKWSSAGILDWGRAANKIEVNIPWLPFENETRCYDEIGCINITREWYHLIYRPLNVFPLPRQVIDTRFMLHTRKQPKGYQLKIQAERNIQKSTFDAKKLTKIIIHGFIDTPHASWVKEMRRELLMHADWNVIVVDWAGGSLPLYTQATANTRLVGLEVAYLINHLKDNHGLNPKDVHIIGHSLGAHTAGYAGERIDKLGRITGLDPAEPYFQGMPEQVRLDPSDADLVDVIHTDGSSIFLLGYGMSEPAGHVDFYPNNGKEQPGCDLTETPLPLTLIKEGIEEASRVLVACNHVRAIKLFTESINSKCPYVAHRCPSYQHFMQGKCFSCEENNSSCAIMGLQSDLNRGLVPGSKYFVATGKEPPFCRRHYKVTLDLARPPRAETWVQGFMKVTLHSDNGVIRNLDLTPNGYEKLEHGTSRSFVVTHPDDIGRIRRIEFYWEYDMDVLQPRSICFLWCNDHLYVASIRVTETKDITARDKRQIETKSKLCSTGLKEYADIASRTSAVFVDDCDDDLV